MAVKTKKITSCPDCGCGSTGGEYCTVQIYAYAYRSDVKDSSLTACYYSGRDISLTTNLDSNYCFKGYQPGHETPVSVDMYRFDHFGTQRCFQTEEERLAFLSGLGEYWDTWWYQAE